MVNSPKIIPNQTIRVMEPNVKFIPKQGLVAKATLNQIFWNSMAKSRMILARSPGEFILGSTMFIFAGIIVKKFWCLPENTINPYCTTENFKNFNIFWDHNKNYKWNSLENNYEKINQFNK